ncbi:glucosaminidase domain-containing protein [Bacteroidales bacterium OttesenSCG-928-K22]|nr:glucosaminidase domain-containing protein [Bacteroidales bacterium OttesenSCG-928-K22]
MKLRKYIILLLITLSINSFSQINERQEYAKKYGDIAVRKMKEFGIPASITLAQGILESGCGKSELATKANNHFGIKCHKEWTGKKYYYDDDAPQECFRRYNKVEDSFDDHSLFLTTRDRYADLFKLDVSDYKSWAHGLKKAGYATNPNYAPLLIKIIEENQLFMYDMVALGAMDIADIPDNLFENLDNLEQNTIIDNSSEIYELPTSVNKYQYQLGLCLCMDEAVYTETYKNRHIFRYNKVYAIFAEENETLEQISQTMNVPLRQLRSFNDLPKGAKISTDDIIYLDVKNNKGSASFHITGNNETLWGISQCYTVKLSKLIKKNGINEVNTILKPGKKIKL